MIPIYQNVKHNFSDRRKRPAMALSLELALVRESQLSDGR
jgi:hypothetical protein